MIQCKDCEHFVEGADGQVGFKCNPFGNIKEPECLAKWQLLRLSEVSQKLDRMVSAYEATVELHQRMQPMQEKMFRYMEQELSDQEQGEAWKYGESEDDSDTNADAPDWDPPR